MRPFRRGVAASHLSKAPMQWPASCAIGSAKTTSSCVPAFPGSPSVSPAKRLPHPRRFSSASPDSSGLHRRGADDLCGSSVGDEGVHLGVANRDTSFAHCPSHIRAPEGKVAQPDHVVS
jgi:hypothetical protein